MMKRLNEINPELIKWVVLPLLAVIGFTLLFSVASDRRKCEQTCTEEGFPHARYIPESGRYTKTPERCYCLTGGTGRDHRPGGGGQAGLLKYLPAVTLFKKQRSG